MSKPSRSHRRHRQDEDYVPKFLREEMPYITKHSDVMSLSAPSGASDPYPSMAKPGGISPSSSLLLEDPTFDTSLNETANVSGSHNNGNGSFNNSNSSYNTSAVSYNPSMSSYTANGKFTTPQRNYFTNLNTSAPGSAGSHDGSTYYSANSSGYDTSNSNFTHMEDSFEDPSYTKSNRDRMTLNAAIYRTASAANSPRLGNNSSLAATPMKMYRKNQESIVSDGSPIIASSSSPAAATSTPVPRKISDTPSITYSPTTVSWNANDANEWTKERTLNWLRANKFDREWIDIFRDNNIYGHQFLSMANYQNLKKLGLSGGRGEYDTRPSHFIHLLRKLLNKSISAASNEIQMQSPDNFSSPNPSTSPQLDFNLPPNDVFIADIPATNALDDKTAEKHVPFTSASPGPAPETLHRAPKSFENLANVAKVQARTNTSRALLQDRPMSTFEGSNLIRSMWQSPSSPVLKGGSGAFLRRHRRTSSSESALSVLADPTDDKSAGINPKNALVGPSTSMTGEIADRNSRGIFNRLKSRTNRSRSRDPLLPSISYLSTAAEGSSSIRIKDASDKYSFLPQNLRPITPANLDKSILVTTNNEEFKYFSLASMSVSTVDELRSMLAGEFMIPINELALHVTEVGHEKGAALDDSAVKELIFGVNPLDVVKLFLSRRANVSTHSSAGSSWSPYDSTEDPRPLYPATPAYLIHDGSKKDNNVEEDYFNIRPAAPLDSKTSSLSSSSGAVTTSSSSNALYSAPSQSLSSEFFKKEMGIDESQASFRVIRREFSGSNDSFKVIRPQRREINFDDRRPSPYDNKKQTNLVALREAPPPPPSRQSSVKLMRAKSQKKPQNHPKLAVDSTLAAPNTGDDKDVKLYSPGQSESLIPRPYVSRKHMVVRKPVGAGTSKGSGSDLIATPDSAGSQYQAVQSISGRQFTENEISWDGAPEFIDDSSDGESSDSGLWAKKPPPSNESSATNTLVNGENLSHSDKNFSKPDLKLITSAASVLSPSSPFKSASSNFSPMAPEDIWSVRPPAEVVYDNLERFFPHTDLDKPIIDEASVNVTQAFLPVGVTALPGNVINASILSPVVEPKDSPTQTFKDSLPAPVLTTPPDAELKPSKQRVPSKRPGAHRMKSIRVVAREASEARRRLSSMTSTSSSIASGALLRRKSTKLWGQKVVEMTPRDMERGHLSKLRDQKGGYKQYFWVKGELIGKGTFGKVYLALNATTGEMMAVKQVEVPYTSSDKASQRQREVIEALHSEVETLKDLDHLNIVQYLGFEALNDVYSMFLEYVPGGSVGRILQLHGRFQEPLIKLLTSQVLEGLSYLHCRGILHRDLKADNLLLDLDGVCKISDFGISKKSRDIYANDAEMSMQGTIFWMAPEVIHNVVHNEKQGYSAKVDVWSLGCVVLEMFAGRRPWSTDEAIGAMYKLGTSRQAPPIPEDTIPYVSDVGKNFLDQCFTIDPHKRPTAQELLEHIFSKVDDDFEFSKTDIAKKIRFSSKGRKRPTVSNETDVESESLK